MRADFYSKHRHIHAHSTVTPKNFSPMTKSSVRVVKATTEVASTPVTTLSDLFS